LVREMTNELTRRVASYGAQLHYEAIAPEAIERAKQLLLDFIGVALGGAALWPEREAMLRSVVVLAASASGDSTVVGQSAGFVRQYAAWLNGAFAHSMDFDDTHREAIMHVGAPVFPALLAVGEDATGVEFLRAIVAGYEVAGQLGTAHGDRVHLRGFHPTATTGVFASTAAAGSLMGLEPEVIEDALGLALSLAGATQQFGEGGGANKPVQVGLAAHNALVALAMAQAGVPGAKQALEGRFGYYATFAEPGSDLDRVHFDLESPSQVLRVGMKPYPCCRYSHGTIDGVREIVRREGLRPDDIEAIDVTLPPAGFGLVGASPETKRRPAALVDAQFSVYFAAAVAASQPAYSWDSYALLDAPGVRRMMDRVTVSASESLSEMQTRLAVRAKGGAWTLDVPLPRGEPETSLRWEELEAKFRSLALRTFDDARCDAIVGAVKRLEMLGSVRELTGLLRT
jgi:2-methylcitrate dehydratase PrpD